MIRFIRIAWAPVEAALNGLEFAPAQRLGDVVHPPVGMEPAVHVEHVPHDEHEGDHAGRPLQGIADVAGVFVGAAVGEPATDDHDAENGVEQQRDER